MRLALLLASAALLFVAAPIVSQETTPPADSILLLDRPVWVRALHLLRLLRLPGLQLVRCN